MVEAKGFNQNMHNQ